MFWKGCLLIPLMLCCTLSPTYAAGIFRKTPKPDPNERYPALIQTLKSDPDDRKRADAAEELKDADPRAFPELLPALIEALQKDSSTSVRVEAAYALGKIRPITQQAGFALEQALAKDEAIRVRLAARSALWQYHLAGYRSNKHLEPMGNLTGEPPLANSPRTTTSAKTPVPSAATLNPAPAVTIPVNPGTPRPTTSKSPTAPARPTRQEPPLADPLPSMVERKPLSPELPKSNARSTAPQPVLIDLPPSWSPAKPKDPPADGPRLGTPKF